MLLPIYPNGKVTLTIAATESVAVATYGASGATVQRVLGYPNVPDTISNLGTVANGQTVFGPYTSGATIIINAGGDPVYYETGVAPIVKWFYDTSVQTTPVAVDVTGAVSAAAILGGIVTSTTAAAVAGTVPTGTVMDAAAEWAVNDACDWSVIATGANAFTVTAASGHTLVGTAAVATATSGRFRTRKTAANTFVTYRLA